MSANDSPAIRCLKWHLTSHDDVVSADWISLGTGSQLATTVELAPGERTTLRFP